MSNWYLATYQNSTFKNNLDFINPSGQYVYKLQDPIDNDSTSVNENNWLRIDITHADKTVSNWDTNAWSPDTSLTGLVNGSIYWVYGTFYPYIIVTDINEIYRLQTFRNDNSSNNIIGVKISDNSDTRSIDKDHVTSVMIGNSVASIDHWLFQSYDNMTSVNIGNSVETIGQGAFAQCKNLTSVIIPDSVGTIGVSAFTGCEKLASVTIGNSVTEIGDRAFYECEDLVSVNIPDSVTKIGDFTFYKCASLVYVNIGNSVTEIGNDAFYQCDSLRSVTIPDSVTTIGMNAFKNCANFEIVTIGNLVNPSIGANAFSDISDNAIIIIPQNVLNALNTKYGSTSFWTELSHGSGKSFFGSPDTVTLEEPYAYS